jgi:hypothetical protein
VDGPANVGWSARACLGNAFAERRQSKRRVTAGQAEYERGTLGTARCAAPETNESGHAGGPLMNKIAR